MHLSDSAIGVRRKIQQIVRESQQMRNRVRRRIGMYIDDGFAALQFFENRLQGRVSEVHAIGIGKENEAIEPEDVERMGELLQRGIYVRQRQAGETSEPIRS